MPSIAEYKSVGYIVGKKVENQSKKGIKKAVLHLNEVTIAML